MLSFDLENRETSFEVGRAIHGTGSGSRLVSVYICAHLALNHTYLGERLALVQQVKQLGDDLLASPRVEL